MEEKKRKVGRPKGSVKGYSIARPQHQVRAYEDEWEVIKEFAKVAKKDIELAKRMLKTK